MLAPTAAASPHPHYSFAEQRTRIFAIVAASSGNLVEWFDFYVYAFTALYFAPAFFPKADPTAQLLNSAGVFAAGFLMRPIGSWLFGRVADRYGRKRSLIVSVLLMCAGSLMVAALPTYAAIGAFAPGLLLVARLLQGLSVGGEYGTTATYMSEVALRGRRGFFSSFQYVTLIGGQLLAVLLVVLLQQVLSETELRAWGWRVPFAVSAVAAVVAFWLRSSLHETLDAEVAAQEGAGRSRAVPQAQGGIPDRARVHRGRLAHLLHLHDLHAEVPGQLGRHEHANGEQRDDRVPLRLYVHPAAVRRAVRPHRPAQQHAPVRRPGNDCYRADLQRPERDPLAVDGIPPDRAGAGDRQLLYVRQRNRESRALPGARARPRRRPRL
jgi:uncharacterized integral membrane protein